MNCLNLLLLARNDLDSLLDTHLESWYNVVAIKEKWQREDSKCLKNCTWVIPNIPLRERSADGIIFPSLFVRARGYEKRL